MQSLALAVLASLQGGSSAEPVAPPSRVVAIELDATDAPLAQHGPCERVEYEATYSGTLHVWLLGEESFDTFLRVEDTRRGLLAEDDDSGGKPVAYLKVVVEPGMKLVITAAAARPDVTSGNAALHMVASPETARTREEAALAEAEWQDIQDLRQAKRLDEARDRMRALVERITNVPGGLESDLVAAAASKAGYEAYWLDLTEPTEKVWGFALRCRESNRPPDHDALNELRKNYAAALRLLGRVAETLALEERALASFERTKPPDDADLLSIRQDIAVTYLDLGRFDRARDFFASVLESRERLLPEGDPKILDARMNLATALYQLRDYEGARALQEPLVLAYERMRLPDDPDLQMIRGNLASTLRNLGELESARALLERVLEVRERTLPETHPRLQNTRGNLSNVLVELGDIPGGLALLRKVLAVRERILPEDHLDVQVTRLNLAELYEDDDQHELALKLQQEALAVYERVLPKDHARLFEVRGGIAATLTRLYRFEEAKAIQVEVLAEWERTLPEDHRAVQGARAKLAITLRHLGELDAARELQERIVAVVDRTLPEDDGDFLAAHVNLATTMAFQAAARSADDRPSESAELETEREAYLEHVAAGLRSIRLMLRAALTDASPREAEARVSAMHGDFGRLISLARGFGVFTPDRKLTTEAFLLHESGRSAAHTVARLQRKAGSDADVGTLRARIRELSRVIAGGIRPGTDAEALDRARRALDATNRELVLRAGALGSESMLESDLDPLAEKLGPRDAIVSWRRMTRYSVRLDRAPADGGTPELRIPVEDRLCAFIVRRADARTETSAEMSSAQLAYVDLGPFAAVEAAVDAWRSTFTASGGQGGAAGRRATDGGGRGMGVAATRDSVPPDVSRRNAAAIARLVLEPLRSELQGVDHIIVALDDALHLVPLDALPAGSFAEGRKDASEALLGDVLRVEIRSNPLEIITPDATPSGAPVLVAFGGAAFAQEPLKPDPLDEIDRDGARPAIVSSERVDTTATIAPRPASLAGVLRRTTTEGGFAELPATLEEVHGIAAELDARHLAGAHALVCEGRRASRANLEVLAPRARWLHVATHGWYSPDSNRSDGRESAERGAGAEGAHDSEPDAVGALSPLVLCGLAFAGASLPQDALGRIPGLITAQELAAFDLSNCELAVLSACDTHSGKLSRAGQGVSSLQRALHMAGARSVITSLWSVPDDATRELMTDFYRRLWVEKKPKHQALWEAKKQLREAQDESGELKYTTRDWAAWVLTGSPE